jgi:S1-C subfamily serine protease
MLAASLRLAAARHQAPPGREEAADVTVVDVLVLVLVASTAATGLRKGLVWGALSAVGTVGGAVAGALLAPHLLRADESPYAPLVALGGAVAGAVLLETVGTATGLRVRRALARGPLRPADSGGGLVLGTAWGLAVAWVLGAVALHVPGAHGLREAVQSSAILQRLNAVLPPERVIEALERVDPLPAIVGPPPPDEPADPAVLDQPGVSEAAPSVVRVVGSACGLAMAGSGWVARPGLVVTNAHVIAGQRNTRIQAPGTRRALAAQAVAFDARNDVAVLRVEGLETAPLALGQATQGTAVAILGYPGAGSLSVTAGRIGRTVTIVGPDAYGRGRAQRTVTSFRGEVRRGNSGGPAVNAQGEVETTVFGARLGDEAGGFGVPPAIVERSLDAAAGPVSTGPCVPG